MLLGTRHAERLDAAREAQVVAEQLAADRDETVQVAVLDGEYVVCIAKAGSTQPVRVVAAARVPGGGGGVRLGGGP